QDPDVGSNSVRSYTLSKSEYFTLKMKELPGGRLVPEMVLEKVLDREKQSVHELVVTALDGGNPVKSGVKKVTVTVLDINDNVPVFKRHLYNVSVPENSPRDTVLVTVEATDQDEGPNGEVEYVFTEHTPQSTLSVFSLNSDTGEIKLKGELDYENITVFEMHITAKDKGVPKMEGHCRVQVQNGLPGS
uniref:Cadherin domain-containing protein n=1 Tax=Periophthalmus magnuspinnatus TaxID=409849 RepID=A0A3B4B235_9GOBI